MVFVNGGSSLRSINLMQKAMDATILRNQVINDNIANATTPNYKRKDVTFHAELERAVNSEKNPMTPFKTSREKHIPVVRARDYNEVKPKIITEYNTYQNNNGNSVDIDKEMLEDAKNTLYFNALAQRTASTFNKLKYLMRS